MLQVQIQTEQVHKHKLTTNPHRIYFFTIPGSIWISSSGFNGMMSLYDKAGHLIEVRNK